MGCDRESRLSEQTFSDVFRMMPNLAICVWSAKGLIDDVKEDVEIIKNRLDNMVKQMEAEENE